MTQKERFNTFLQLFFDDFFETNEHFESEQLVSELNLFLAKNKKAILDSDCEKVVHCADCQYLGIKDFVYGYCKKNMCGIVYPRTYCSDGGLKNRGKK